jgi:hypothetical protein
VRCLLHTRGCDGRFPCSVERDVRAAIATRPTKEEIRRQKMSDEERRRRVREMRAAGRWKR